MMTADNDMMERLVNGLESTTKLAQALLQEAKESEKEFSAVKTELAILKDNFKALSRIIQDGNGEMSIMTKMALLDQKLQLMSKADDEIDDIEQRMVLIEEHIREVKDNKRAAIDSFNREIELVHENKISATKVKEEKQKAITQVIAGILIAIIASTVGYFTKGGK